MKCITCRRQSSCSSRARRSAAAQPDASAAGQAIHGAGRSGISAIGRSAGAIRAWCSARLRSWRCICAASRCSRSQGAALATAALTFLNQMVFVQSRIAMLDIYALTFDLFGDRRVYVRLSEAAAGARLCARRPCLWACRRLQMERLFSARGLHRDRCHHRACCRDGARSLPTPMPTTGTGRTAGRISATIISRCASSLFRRWRISRPSFPLRIFHRRFIEAQRRIFAENAGAHPPHLYMSSWPSWPLLMRPIWYQFDKIADERFQAIVFLGNPLILWPALAALGICLRDFIVKRRADAFLILAVLSRAVAGLGDAAAQHRLHLLLSAVGHHRHAGAGLCADPRRARAAALGVVGVCRGVLARLCGDAADLGGDARDVDADLPAADDLSELDLDFLERTSELRRQLMPCR